MHSHNRISKWTNTHGSIGAYDSMFAAILSFHSFNLRVSKMGDRSLSIDCTCYLRADSNSIERYAAKPETAHGSMYFCIRKNIYTYVSIDEYHD